MSVAILFILGIIACIIMFLVENPALMVVIVLIVLLIVIAVIVKKSAEKQAEEERKQAEINEYYRISRWLSLINANQYVDKETTDKINATIANGNTVSIGKSNDAFAEFKRYMTQVFNSVEILYPGNKIIQYELKRENTRVYDGALSKYKILPQCDPIILHETNSVGRGLNLYVFPETILAFVKGPEKIVFISAYKYDALSIVRKLYHERKIVAVGNGHCKHARNYEHYNPISDSSVSEVAWLHPNVDGTRNRRLLPENNPLSFTLKYGELKWTLGEYAFSANFSNDDIACKLYASYKEYKSKK